MINFDERSCLNCNREYSCAWNKEMYCEEWNPDFDTKRMMDTTKKESRLVD